MASMAESGVPMSPDPSHLRSCFRCRCAVRYDEGWKVGPVTPMTLRQFKDWIRDADTTKTAAEAELAHPDDSTEVSEATLKTSPVRTVYLMQLTQRIRTTLQ